MGSRGRVYKKGKEHQGHTGIEAMTVLADQLRGKAVWFWAAVSVLLTVTVLFSSQAFSASMSLTAQPLQNAGDGDLTYTSDWSAALGGGGSPGSVSLIPTGDAHTKLDKPTTNYGTNRKLEVKVSAPTKQNRSYLQFDISSIPAGATIDSATLKLCVNKAGDAGRNYDVHRITGSWTELGIVHNNQPSVLASATATIVTLGTVDCNQVWTVTADVAAWHGGTATNYGLRVNDQDESSETQYKQTYNSRDTNLGDAQKPKLDVNYTEADSYTMRHEKSTATLNGSDQVTSVTVEGTKDSHTGTKNITVNLLDASATLLATGSGTLPTAAGTPYSVAISMSPTTVKYNTITTIQVIYT